MLKWAPHVNAAKTMLAFLSIELPSGLVLRDLRLMHSPQGRRWIAMPSVKQLDRDGQTKLDASGKPTWADIVDFRDRRTRDKFQDPILELLRRLHPEAFEGELP